MRKSSTRIILKPKSYKCVSKQHTCMHTHIYIDTRTDTPHTQTYTHTQGERKSRFNQCTLIFMMCLDYLMSLSFLSGFHPT